MALGNPIGEFSFTSTGVTISASGNGGATNTVNYEGTATGYGTVVGTMTLNVPAPGATTGTFTWIAQAFLENGETKSGTAEGVWNEGGPNQWRVRAINLVSDGTVMASDGIIDLASRSYNGALLEWE